MKSLLLGLVLTSLSSTAAFAHLYFGPESMSTISTMSPFISAYECSVKIDKECLVSAASVSLSSSVLLKEEIRHVEVDAYDFLAGAPMTEALEEVIGQVRAEVKTLELQSDEEVVVIMLDAVK